ncbi:hypothetical protein C8Q73DRAFT_199385 [Cubamyces lactineus]|nr:hypothetical protein C8Q73DRAFT_199385 [Cubamyces lactineus]
MTELLAKPAPNTSFWTPAQEPPAGTAAPPKDGKPIPSLFQPVKIRGLELHNRLLVAPMGMSSGNHNSSVTPFHFAMLGSMILHGPGLTFIEATAVSPEGRATVHDCGLWSDEQKIGIQLAHAGRKGSLSPLWLAGRGVVPKAAGGHAEDVIAPSAIPYVEEEKPAKWNVDSKANGTAVPNGRNVLITVTSRWTNYI